MLQCCSASTHWPPAAGYGPMQFPAQPIVMPQLPAQLQLAPGDAEGEREEELNNNIDEAVAHYPSMVWGAGPGQQPVLYPMMMMMPMSPLGQPSGDPGQRMLHHVNPPDVVEAGQGTDADHPQTAADYRGYLSLTVFLFVRIWNGIISHLLIVCRYDHDVTPDLVRATEPTYMNENVAHLDQVPTKLILV